MAAVGGWQQLRHGQCGLSETSEGDPEAQHYHWRHAPEDDRPSISMQGQRLRLVLQSGVETDLAWRSC